MLITVPGTFSYGALKSKPATTRKDTTDNSIILAASFYRYDSLFSLKSQKGYLPSLLNDYEVQLTAPSHFNGKQWILTGATISTTAALFTLDGKIDSWAKTQRQSHRWIRESSPFVTQFGNQYGYCLVGTVGVVSAMFDRPRGFETSLLATQAMITSGIWTRMIKTFTGRERPKGAYVFSHDSGGEWFGPFSQVSWLTGKKPIYEFDAFPSGHTSQAFAIATVFAMRYNDLQAVPVICYSAASLVGVSRIIEHEHWASDVFVGALIGYFCGKQVVNNFNNTHPQQFFRAGYNRNGKPALSLIQSGNQIGISMKW